MVRELINYDKLLICQDCNATINEFCTYRYPSETERNCNNLIYSNIDTPIKINDDCMDALRYALYKYLSTFKIK